MKELTRQQQAVYDYVKSYIEEKSYPPTIREIGAAVGLSSTSTVHSHVKTLIDKGYLVSSPSTQRTIALAMPERINSATSWTYHAWVRLPQAHPYLPLMT